jgi:two-component system sensor histidine kinase KdpD
VIVSVFAHRRVWLIALIVLAATTVALLAIRESLDKTHVALAYLLIVLGASSRGGRALGIAVSVAAFLCFNFFFLLPYYTLTVADSLNWAVLASFLLTSLIAAQLLARARREATSAERRATEVERLATLGAESLKTARAEDALRAIAEVIRTTLGAAGCEVHIREDGANSTTARVAQAGEPRSPRSQRDLGQPSAEEIIEWVAINGRAAVELGDGSTRVADAGDPSDLARVYTTNVQSILLPLHVGELSVGVLTVVPRSALTLDKATQRFLRALSYYAALGIERLKLTREADRAEALQKADQVRNAVLASVSHDLRTPLTTIKALANEIRQTGDERAATIEEEADRLNRFVADLLDLSRLSGGALQVKPEINAAEDLIGAALQRVSGALHDRTVVASLDASEPLLLGRFDFVHSLRVLGNLIDNAIRFAPPESAVEVSARRQNGALEFAVADRGPGIPLADREFVFQPFYRGLAGAQDRGGVGLGLSIARGLAEAQRGMVRYEERLGGGSLFIFSVPAADVSELNGRED